MFNEVRWKFIIVSVMLAMAVSLVAGGLSGINLGVLILRAFAGGIVFGILALGLNILALRYFPELFESDDSPMSGGDIGPDDEEELPGNRVNIVVPVQGPTDPDRAETGTDDSVEAVVGSSMDAGAAPSEPGYSSESDGEDVDELESAGDSSSGGESLGDLDRFTSDFDDVAEESSSKKTVSDGPMSDNDPEEIAQAIHTVMSRDEKG